MLEDRDYMRQPAYESRVSFTVAVLIVNAAVFLVQWLFSKHWPGSVDFADNYFALSLGGMEHGYVWQLLTFQFMHASIWHLVINSLAIYFFGRSVETALGGARFLTLYFTSGIIGGLVQILFSWITSDDSSVVGASAGAAGLVGAFSLLAWDEQFTILLYFILPIRLSGKILFWVSTGLFLVEMMIPNSRVANAAHLGGVLAGFFYVRQIVQGRWHFPQWTLPSRPSAPRQLAAKHASAKSFWRPTSIPPAEDLTAAEFLQKEVDPILDKISERGIQSLTAREREILEKARSKMNKR